jgi:hypothetical protein
MPEIGTSGSMSGDGKRGVAEWPKLPRPSSTLPSREILRCKRTSAFRGTAEVAVARAKRGMTRNEYREDQFAALRQSHFQDASLTRYYALSEG